MHLHTLLPSMLHRSAVHFQACSAAAQLISKRGPLRNERSAPGPPPPDDSGMPQSSRGSFKASCKSKWLSSTPTLHTDGAKHSHANITTYVRWAAGPKTSSIPQPGSSVLCPADLLGWVLSFCRKCQTVFGARRRGRIGVRALDTYVHTVCIYRPHPGYLRLANPQLGNAEVSVFWDGQRWGVNHHHEHMHMYTYPLDIHTLP